MNRGIKKEKYCCDGYILLYMYVYLVCLYSGSCIITYWKTGRWLGPVACPNCRQTVTILMNYFTPDELREDDSELKNTVLTEVLNYNRRFSGEPRSVSLVCYSSTDSIEIGCQWNEQKMTCKFSLTA